MFCRNTRCGFLFVLFYHARRDKKRVIIQGGQDRKKAAYIVYAAFRKRDDLFLHKKLHNHFGTVGYRGTGASSEAAIHEFVTFSNSCNGRASSSPHKLKFAVTPFIWSLIHQ